MARIWNTSGEYFSTTAVCLLPDLISIHSLMQQCEAFLVSMGLLRNGEVFFCRTPRREVPTFIVAWIMNTYVPFLLFLTRSYGLGSGVTPSPSKVLQSCLLLSEGHTATHRR